MTGTPVSEVTLRALSGRPLQEPRIRDMVVATAQAIAERHGVNVLDVQTTPDRITVRLNTGRIEAVGFAAELRRLTTRWYTQKFGESTLWGELLDDGDEWKNG